MEEARVISLLVNGLAQRGRLGTVHELKTHGV